MNTLIADYKELNISERQPVTFEEVEQIWTQTVSPALKTFETMKNPNESPPEDSQWFRQCKLPNFHKRGHRMETTNTQFAEDYQKNGFLTGIPIADASEATRYQRAYNALEAEVGKEKCEIGLIDWHFDYQFIWELAHTS